MLNDILKFIARLFAAPGTPQAPPIPPQIEPPAEPIPPHAAPPVRPQAAALPPIETDARVQLLNSFLLSPHGKLAELAPLHAQALERDPLFYGHLATWYLGRGEVRDHKVLFTAHLLTSEFADLREAGWVLLQGLPPHMVAAVLGHAKRVIGKTPRMLKSAVAHYLRMLEDRPERFDRAALRARNDLKGLYASLRIAPGKRAQQVLFENDPPPESPLYALKLLARAQDPAEQAQVIATHRIPYPIAVGALRTLTPVVLVALLDAMTPQETINHLAALKKRGAFDSPEVKALIEVRLRAAEHDPRVASLKATRASAAVELDSETEALLTQVTDRRVARMAKITRPTALFVDKSGSMTDAINVAKELAALISAVCTDFRVLAFDEAAFEVQAAGSERSSWERAFAMVRANGSTSIGAPLDRLLRKAQYVEQLVIITDCGENHAPFFRTAYAEYAQALKIEPQVIVVTVGSVDQGFLARLREAGIPLTVWEFKGDYYALPNLLPLLAAPTRAELVEQIMQTELPRREA